MFRLTRKKCGSILAESYVEGDIRYYKCPKPGCGQVYEETLVRTRK